ncbi:MAG: ABC transporter ATP-binding protein [Pseudomonadota bacterium]
MSTTSLSASDVSVHLGAQTVLNRVDFSAHGGEVVGVLGPNGAGKSTLLKAVLGLVESSGAITIDGQNIRDITSQERGRLIAYLPQDRDVAWPMTVGSVVALGRLPHRQPLARLSNEDQEAIGDAMAMVDVTDFESRRISELSGGERARVLVARALAQRAPILLVDEPTSGLDPAHQLSLLALFRKRAAEGLLVVVTLHELHFASRWCDRILLLEDGHIVGDGAPADVLSPERVRAVYGCNVRIIKDDDGDVVLPISQNTHDQAEREVFP